MEEGEGLGKVGAAGDPVRGDHDQGVLPAAQVVQGVVPLGPDLAAGGYAGVDEHPPAPLHLHGGAKRLDMGPALKASRRVPRKFPRDEASM